MNNSPANPLSGAAEAPCKACGAKSYQKIQTGVPGEGEQRTWSCMICQDGWTVTLTEKNGGTLGRWVHIPQWSPLLVRTIHLPVPPDSFMPENDPLTDVNDDEWAYRLGSDKMGMERWFKLLEVRRKNLKNRLAQ